MKKYAVYKSETGYYCYEYCDTTQSLKGTLFENIITEDRLPVVLDGKGGYYHFDPEKDFSFVKIIESDKKNPLPLEQMFFKNDKNFKLGWISPSGDTYSCDYTSHAKAAVIIAEKFYPGTKFPERRLGRAGWIKVIDSWDGVERQHGQFVYSMSGRITSPQADKLFDLGLYDNPEVRNLIGDNEGIW